MEILRPRQFSPSLDRTDLNPINIDNAGGGSQYCKTIK